MTCLYAKKKTANQAMVEYINALVYTLRNDSNNPLFIACKSIDFQSALNSMAEYTSANKKATAHLNRAMREPETLVFYKWGVYKVTVNDTRNRLYNYSSITLLVDLPSSQEVQTFS